MPWTDTICSDSGQPPILESYTPWAHQQCDQKPWTDVGRNPVRMEQASHAILDGRRFPDRDAKTSLLLRPYRFLLMCSNFMFLSFICPCLSMHSTYLTVLPLCWLSKHLMMSSPCLAYQLLSSITEVIAEPASRGSQATTEIIPVLTQLDSTPTGVFRAPKEDTTSIRRGPWLAANSPKSPGLLLLECHS